MSSRSEWEEQRGHLHGSRHFQAAPQVASTYVPLSPASSVVPPPWGGGSFEEMHPGDMFLARIPSGLLLWVSGLLGSPVFLHGRVPVCMSPCGHNNKDYF